MSRRFITIGALVAFIALSGCGNKGPLTLPDQAPPVADTSPPAQETE